MTGRRTVRYPGYARMILDFMAGTQIAELGCILKVGTVIMAVSTGTRGTYRVICRCSVGACCQATVITCVGMAVRTGVTMGHRDNVGLRCSIMTAGTCCCAVYKAMILYQMR